MNRGEIWLVNLDPTIGKEISKTRPCVIVNDNAIGILPLKVIVPITDWKERFAIRPWMVKVEPTSENSLVKVSAVDTFQIRSVSETRLIKQLGKLSDTQMQLVSQALAIVLSIV
ncbi:MAG: type II toxin-antitoxin system PemK/MazF family toxin [Rivularia sp. (in: cyanobacteria)]